jgi:hypothetical protein
MEAAKLAGVLGHGEIGTIFQDAGEQQFEWGGNVRRRRRTTKKGFPKMGSPLRFTKM